MASIAGKILIASIPVLVTLYIDRWREHDERYSLAPDNPPNLNLPTKETYDFIIVGGGTAGCVLASRLSEKFSVLVLEAGSKPPPLVDVPGLLKQVDNLTDISFDFHSTPQKNVGRQTNGIVPVYTGKMLGGSGSFNGLVWERGNPHDYNRWAALTKDESWKYQNVRKYFKKIEHHKRNKGGRKDGQNHQSSGTVGLIDLIESPLAHLSDRWLEAGKELGYKIRNFHETQHVGFRRIHYASSNGSRGSSYKVYLKPVMKKRRKLLKVFTYSFVSKVIIENKKAVGVEYRRHGVARAAFASKEVILCAGALMSPIILFKSGIGPKDQVEAAKAESHVVNLPVGKNLQDHPRVRTPSIQVNDSRITWNLERNITFRNIHDFTKRRKGPLTTTLHVSVAFLESNQSDSVKQVTKRRGSQDWPNLQIIYYPTAVDPGSVSGYIFVGRPMSRGVLKINGSATGMDDNNIVLIDFNYFNNPKDLDVIVEGINFFLKVMGETKVFKKIGARLSTTPYGPCKMYKFRSTDYWKCFVRYTSSYANANHASGTCRMGHGRKDADAVVDSKLRVIGVRGLRVVDASVFPYITNANIYSTVVVVAEIAADKIRKAHL